MAKQKHISLKKLVQIASKAYQLHGEVEDDWKAVTDEEGKLIEHGILGDTLAEFIIIELGETYDPKSHREEQIEEAVRVMTNAHNELGRVVSAFEEAFYA